MRKRTVLALVLLMSAAIVKAQLLYKISGDSLGLEKPSYIVGTYHLASGTFAMKIKGIMDAINATDQVYGELKTDELELPGNKAKVEEASRLPDGKTLKDVLSDEQYKKLNVFLKDLQGADLNNAMVANKMGRMTPQALATHITMLLYLMNNMSSFDPLNLIDDYFQKIARKNNEPVGGFETVDYQVSTLYSYMTMERQIENLMCVVDNSSYAVGYIDRIMKAYYRQDMDALHKVMIEKRNNGCDSTPEEEEVLIYGRNKAWVEAMPAIMEERPTLFVVGAAHLPGERGVLSLLREAGYVVEACE